MKLLRALIGNRSTQDAKILEFLQASEKWDSRVGDLGVVEIQGVESRQSLELREPRVGNHRVPQLKLR